MVKPGRHEDVMFNGTPGLVVRWEGREETWPFDVRQALEDALAPYSPPHRVTAAQVVDYALEQRSVCLILDALDQVTDDFTPSGERIRRYELLDRIFRFINSEAGQRCHVVITGRSYAVTRETEGNRFPREVWTFATLEGFSQHQQARYLNDFLDQRALADFIPSYDQVSELLEVPVILSLIAEIGEADPRPRSEVCLDQFQARGDVYREAHNRLADRAEKTLIQASVSARARWEAILAAAAFEMMCDERQRRNYTVSGPQAVDRFRATVAHGAREVEYRDLEITDRDWDELAAFSQLTHRASIDNWSGFLMSWKHRGWMEYFAGVYLARYASPQAVARAAEFHNEPDWYWAWRFAIEMPDEVVDTEVRAATLANLFRRADGRRPNELVYRAWNIMESTTSGRDVLAEFQSEYRELLAKNDPVAEQIQASFRPCPPDPVRDSLTFLLGAPDSEADAWDDERPQIPMTVEPFEMAATPVTNSQYWLYDPFHQQDPEIADLIQAYSPQDDCPVMCVSWYDAWCFARWCGGRLPTEVEWEYACRAGTATRYSFDDAPDKLGEYAWFAENSNDQTHPVADKKPNAWGFYDLHGNVWEWVQNWWWNYSDGPSAVDQEDHGEGSGRVFRGGSWGRTAGNCRSAVRSRIEPDGRYNYVGFRLARSPSGK